MTSSQPFTSVSFSASTGSS
ncbi:hypothetical protein DNTS_029864 [Danionella cerebrum]|uniref:Uncharacterized protein n=1 Tax=Danionella cerebrum TaxID=2873325 RepID=A0A553QSJ5_9TELE|nr:hypothetical protein DNTS_029864 [Danionella translucida]